MSSIISKKIGDKNGLLPGGNNANTRNNKKTSSRTKYQIGLKSNREDFTNSDKSRGGALTLLTEEDAAKLNSKFDSTYLTMWVMYSSLDSNKSFLLDIGEISEDIIPGHYLNAEDLNRNEILNEGEDTGLDGVFDVKEEGYDSTGNRDSNNDNHNNEQYSSEYYKSIDRPEGNGKLDSEDLNANFNLDIANNYYSYDVPMSGENKYVVETGINSWWKKLKIVLSDFDEKTGNPEAGTLNKIRIWFKGDLGELLLHIAEIKIITE